MSGRRRLLFIAPWFLFPRVSGGRIRTTDVLRGMKDGRFEITLVSPAPPPGQDDWSAELAAICDRFVAWEDDTKRSTLRRIAGLASRLPVSVALDRSANARAVIAGELASSPDVVVFDFVHTAVLAPDRIDVPSVVFTHNVESEIYGRHAAVANGAVSRAVWRNQSAKMARFERAVLQRFDAVVAVSERDAALFRDELGVAEARVIPTGVDVDFYEFRPNEGRGDVTDAGGVLVFTGSMDWRPNIDGLEWFMDGPWPAIHRTSPGTRLVVVGRDPAPALVAEAERRGLPWTFTGFVDDVRPHVHGADACIIPLRVGGGTRLKAYEAMAMGCPVVSTTIGVEGLPLAADEHYLLADGAGDFAAAVLSLLADAALRDRLTRTARTFVAENFSPRVVGEVFERICADVMEQPEVPM